MSTDAQKAIAMSNRRPKNVIPCHCCGEQFLPSSPTDKFHSTRCKLLGNVNRNGPVPQHKPELGPCWVWIAGKYSKRYGHIMVDGRDHGAHCVSYEIFVGLIPKGLQVLHKCDNPSCVRPDHLFTGTQQDNIRDMDEKRRRVNTPHHGEKNGNAGLTEHHVRKLRQLYESTRHLPLRSPWRYTYSEIAEAFGTSPAQACAIVNYKAWSHVA